MLLTIATTHAPATDLGFLLHKHPDKVQSFEITGGKAHVFYPEATAERCSVALLLEIDAINLVRQLKTPNSSVSLQHYVNDRPYVASSFMSHAISAVFASAMNGRCETRPALIDQKMDLEATLAVVKVKGGEGFLRAVFEPLGYTVLAENHILDEVFTDWGNSSYFTVHLRNTLAIKDLLSHLFVLLPVLDNEKHYFISKHEVEKLLAKGGDWLPTHPYKEAIVRRYLRNVGNLTKLAMAQLTDTTLTEDDDEPLTNEPIAVKKRKNDLHFQRLESAAAVLVQSGAQSVVDLGCGEGKLMQILMKIGQFRKITGMDVSMTELRKAKDRLHWDQLSPRELERLTLMQGSLTFRDKRLADFDAAALIEVIEHLDLERLAALERTVFEFAKPKTVVVTTPNSEYNVKYDALSAGDFRHDDHRFEWTRAEFAAWATKISHQFGYTFEILGVGMLDENVGTPSQMAIFKKQV